MATAVEYPHIEAPTGEPARLLRIPRTRVAMIAMDYLAHGWSADEICRQYPYLRHAEVHAAMAYYFDHQDELDAEIRSEWEQVQRDRTKRTRSPFFIRMRAKDQT